MALDKVALGALIKTKIEGKFGAPQDEETLQKFADAVADAVVTHILAAAQVTGQAVVASGSSAGTWPVTGTVT